MDNLHLSYNEVVYSLPYRNLVIMMKDKQHVVYGCDVMKEVDEATFFAQKGLKFSG